MESPIVHPWCGTEERTIRESPLPVGGLFRVPWWQLLSPSRIPSRYLTIAICDLAVFVRSKEAAWFVPHQKHDEQHERRDQCAPHTDR